jgi:hypothetical protein
LVRTKPLARYVPQVETLPSGTELFQAALDYHERHPGFFQYGGEFRSQGVLLPDELLPRAARVKSARKKLPDIFALSGLGVSERLKDSIEALEPGVHQFKEVPVTMKDGNPAPGRYFTTVVGHLARDQVVLERSTIAFYAGSALTKIAPPMSGDDGKVVIDRSRTGGWHLWYSEDIYSKETISDELKERWDALGVDCNLYIYLREVGSSDHPD